MLNELLVTDNPSEYLKAKYESVTTKEKDELRGIIRELKEHGFINVLWADNIPYYVTLNNSARTYEEQLADYEKSSTRAVYDQRVIIGNGNTITNSNIGGRVGSRAAKKKSLIIITAILNNTFS